MKKKNKSIRRFMRFMLKKKTKSELQIKKLGSNESVTMRPYTKPMQTKTTTWEKLLREAWS